VNRRIKNKKAPRQRCRASSGRRTNPPRYHPHLSCCSFVDTHAVAGISVGCNAPSRPSLLANGKPLAFGRKLGGVRSVGARAVITPSTALFTCVPAYFSPSSSFFILPNYITRYPLRQVKFVNFFDSDAQKEKNSSCMLPKREKNCIIEKDILRHRCRSERIQYGLQ